MSWYSIVRNGVLLLIAISGVVLAVRAHSPLPQPSASLVLVVTALGMSFVLLLALQAGRAGLILTLDQLEAHRANAQDDV